MARPLWVCPDCGQSFVSPNMPHSCLVTKSRITFQTRMRFGGIDRPRRDHLVARFVLTRPIESERLLRTDHIPPRYYDHRVRLDRLEDVDDELLGWFGEARLVGDQRHLG